MNPLAEDVPEQVSRVLGDDAVHCVSCGGWHHRLYHKPIPLTEAEEVVIRNGQEIVP